MMLVFAVVLVLKIFIDLEHVSITGSSSIGSAGFIYFRF